MMTGVVVGAYLWIILPIVLSAVVAVFALPYWWRRCRPAEQDGRSWLPGLALFGALLLVIYLVTR